MSLPLNPYLYRSLDKFKNNLNMKVCQSEEDLVIGLINFNENHMQDLRFKIFLID